MSATVTWDELFLPWTESTNDRRFKHILRITLTVFVVLGLILTFVPRPAPPAVKQDLKEVSPRLAKLIIEQKKQPPPPPPIAEKKVVEKEKPAEPKKEPTEIPKDEPLEKPVPQKNTAQARMKASSSGLLALSNKLTTLHDSFDVNDFSNVPLKKKSDMASTSTGGNSDAFKSDLITSGATQTSKGIGSSAVTGTGGGTRLAERATSTVRSSLNEAEAAPASKRVGGGSVRTENEIARVFEENKGAIYSMYNRALRGDPSLQGKVVLEITIEPDGSVSNCRIVSSDLQNPEFEKKVIARVKLFRFKPGDIRQVTIKYPIDFVPS